MACGKAAGEGVVHPPIILCKYLLFVFELDGAKRRGARRQGRGMERKLMHGRDDDEKMALLMIMSSFNAFHFSTVRPSVWPEILCIPTVEIIISFSIQR